MNIDEIKALVRLMVENDLAELDITEGEDKVRLRRGPSGDVAFVPQPVAAAPAGAPAAEAAPEPAPAEEYLEIKSPMVGTFYATASPDSEPYVAVGSRVDDDTIVCIVEAMKVMNEIKAECAGEIVEIVVGNATPVEYGQVLFRVKGA